MTRHTSRSHINDVDRVRESLILTQLKSLKLETFGEKCVRSPEFKKHLRIVCVCWEGFLFTTVCSNEASSYLIGSSNTNLRDVMSVDTTCRSVVVQQQSQLQLTLLDTTSVLLCGSLVSLMVYDPTGNIYFKLLCSLFQCFTCVRLQCIFECFHDPLGADVILLY